MIRKHAYYGGMVQGVGFRYTAKRVAGGYRLGGYVKNMSDGRVELVVEGDVEDVNGFLEELGRAMSYYIRDTQVIDEPFEGGFLRFDVRF